MPQTQMSSQSYYIWTIGCQMNKADSERLAGALEGLGYRECASPKEAGVIVLNSCVVRQSAEDKVTGMITSLKPLKQSDPDRIVALMGCMVGPKTTELERRYPYVDVFMSPQQYAPLIDLIGGRFRYWTPRAACRTWSPSGRRSPPTFPSFTGATSSAPSASSHTGADVRRAVR